MKAHTKASILLITTILALTACSKNVPIETGKFDPTWESLSQWDCPEWFKDAKFGIWAHWGPQCQAEAGDWYARHMYFENEGQYRYHVNTFGNPAEYGLKELCRDWTAEKWEPDSLIKLYKSVGAKYFFTLGQHHDNFDLWNSPYQEWNSVNIGPKRDIIGEWSQACKKYGLPLGISMHGSHTWSWLEKSQDYDGNLTKADGKGTWWEGYDPQELYAQNHKPNPKYKDVGAIHSQWGWQNGASIPSQQFRLKFQNRVLQCINAYNPDILYFDDTVLPFYGYDDTVGQNILTHFYNHSANRNNGTPQVVAMGKILEEQHKEFMMWDVERGVPNDIQNEYWQTCTCLGSWHYSKSTYKNGWYKSAPQVIAMLVDIVSKNGNLLLSVPIRGDGSIDDKEIAILQEIKEWMDINGTSIYGTRTWKTFGEGPMAESSNPLSAQGFNENNKYSAQDIRFVQRNDTLFTTIMRWPTEREVLIKSLGTESPHYSGAIASVELLGYGAIPFKNGTKGLTITLPEQPTNKIAPVLSMTFNQ